MVAPASAWDRLLAEWSVLHGPLGERTAPYDALLARRDALTPGEDAYEAGRLARDHARRVEYWSERLGAPEAAPGAGSRGRRSRRADTALVVAGSVLAIGLIAIAWRTSWQLALAGALGLAGTVAALAYATRASERPRLGDALAAGLCPDCGYDLRGLPPALPVHTLGGLDVGPDACPECGRVWPRVPPPAPARRADDATDVTGAAGEHAQ